MGSSGVFSFPKEEKLHHRSLVERLFRHGKSFYEFPFRVTWNSLSEEELKQNFRNKLPDNIGRLQIMVTVPKKKRKRAVDRVLMRRRIREAYRLIKETLKKRLEMTSGIGTLSIAIVYIHDKNLPYKAVEEKMKALVSKMKEKIDQAEERNKCQESSSI